MEALLNILLWGGIFLLMMRFGCGSHAKGHSQVADKSQAGAAGQLSEPGHTQSRTAHDPGVRWIPPLQDTDPVCGKSVETGKAKSTVFNGRVYYFCSRDCREIFEAAPDLYVDAAISKLPEMEKSHA